MNKLNVCRSKGLLGAIWVTKEQLVKEDGVDIQIKTTLKELITYLLFFAVLLIGNYFLSKIYATWQLLSHSGHDHFLE